MLVIHDMRHLKIYIRKASAPYLHVNGLSCSQERIDVVSWKKVEARARAPQSAGPVAGARLPRTGHVKLQAPRERASTSPPTASQHHHHVERGVYTINCTRTYTLAMADESPKTTAPIPRTTRPMSEALLNEKVQPPNIP
jgi:hypothetical protein